MATTDWEMVAEREPTQIEEHMVNTLGRQFEEQFFLN